MTFHVSRLISFETKKKKKKKISSAAVGVDILKVKIRLCSKYAGHMH